MTNVSPTRRAALAALVVALILALAGTAVAATAHVDGTRVAAHDQPVATVVAAPEHVLAGQGRRTTTEAAKEVVESRAAPTPGTRSGNWIGDHQPVSRTVPPALLRSSICKSPGKWGHDTANRLLSRTGSGPSGDTRVQCYWGRSNALAEEADGTGTTNLRYLVDSSFAALGTEGRTGWTWHLATRPMTGRAPWSVSTSGEYEDTVGDLIDGDLVTTTEGGRMPSEWIYVLQTRQGCPSGETARAGRMNIGGVRLGARSQCSCPAYHRAGCR